MFSTYIVSAFAMQAVFMMAAGYVLMKAGAITCLTIAVGVNQFSLFQQQKQKQNKKQKVLVVSAFAVQAVFMMAAGYVLTKVGAITCLTIAVGIGGFAWSGFSVNHLDIAPQFASILMGLSNTFATLPGIISPALTGAVVTDQVRETRVDR